MTETPLKCPRLLLPIAFPMSSSIVVLTTVLVPLSYSYLKFGIRLYNTHLATSRTMAVSSATSLSPSTGFLLLGVSVSLDHPSRVKT